MFSPGIRRITLACLLVGIGFPICLSFTPLKETPYPISIAVPVASMDFSDLEVRDENNRLVTTPARVQQLKNIFVDNLNAMLVFNLTPYARLMIEFTSRSWDVFSTWLKGHVQRTFLTVRLWWQKQKISFVRGAVLAFLLPLLNESGSRFLSTESPSFHTLMPSLLASTVLLR